MLKEKATRKVHDQYFTPRGVVRAILPELQPYLAGGLVLEPSAGTGNVVAELRRLDPTGHLLAVDIDQVVLMTLRDRFPGVATIVRSYLGLDLGTMRPSLIIGNPPYREAEAFLRKALVDVAPTGAVAFLLRLGFLASQTRAELMRDTMPDVHVLSRRPSFTADGKTDGTDYAWMVWHAARRPGVPSSVRVLPWDDAADEPIGGVQ
jgi:hypothetical protein